MRGVSYAGHGIDEEVIGTNNDHMQSIDGEQLDERMKSVGDRDDGKDMCIPWTMEGQGEEYILVWCQWCLLHNVCAQGSHIIVISVMHKIKWIEWIDKDWRQQYNTPTPNLVFITHSIGAHFVQTLLLRRPDILRRTLHVIHLMPFFRFHPPLFQKLFLSSSARSYKFMIPM